MVGAYDHYEVIPGDQFDGKPRILHLLLRTFDKAELHAAADYGVDDLGRIADGNRQSDAGISLVKFDQSWRQEVAGDRLARLDWQTPTAETDELTHRKLYCVGAMDQGTRLVEQQLPSLRHKNAASDTMEQFRAELPF